MGSQVSRAVPAVPNNPNTYAAVTANHNKDHAAKHTNLSPDSSLLLLKAFNSQILSPSISLVLYVKYMQYYSKCEWNKWWDSINKKKKMININVSNNKNPLTQRLLRRCCYWLHSCLSNQSQSGALQTICKCVYWTVCVSSSGTSPHSK